jgi:hypothetical protein
MANESLKRSVGKPLTGQNKLAYFGPERLPGRPDGVQRDTCSAGLLSNSKLFSVLSVGSSEAGESLFHSAPYPLPDAIYFLSIPSFSISS